MAQSFIILPSDAANTGKQLQTWNNTVATQNVYAEAVVITDSTGIEKATGTNPVRVDPTGTTTQPISASSLPLPTNAAQETGGNLATIAGHITAGIAQDNISQWGATSVTAASTSSGVGTETAPVVRNIPRKYGAVLSTNGSLLASTSYYYPGEVTSPTSANWFDTAKTGSNFVSITVFNNAVAFTGSNQVFLEEADDSADTTVGSGTCASATSNNSLNVQITAGAPITIVAPITKRFYRLRYSIGTTPPGTYKLSYSEYQGAPISLFAQNAQGGPGALYGTGANTGSLGGGDNPTTAVGFVYDNYIDSSGNNRNAVRMNQMSVYAPTGSGQATNLLRTPTTFKTVQATATGNTALWTPTAGKKFRIMRYKIQLTANATIAASGVVTIQFQDSTTNINLAHDYWIGQTALTAATALFTLGDESPWVDLGNGILSSAANNVLNVNLSTTLATGNFRIIVCGTEE